tara:strand:- start:4833 stop:5084 length:252 start_codon:yes stop_codon:yes gene_type:complete
MTKLMMKMQGTGIYTKNLLHKTGTKKTTTSAAQQPDINGFRCLFVPSVAPSGKKARDSALTSYESVWYKSSPEHRGEDHPGFI